MDRLEYWRKYLQILGPFVGFIAAAGALPIGMDSLAAGITYGSIEGYLASGLAIGSGYVLARSGWEERVDRRFAIAFVVLVGVSIYVVGYLETTPNVFQQIGRW